MARITIMGVDDSGGEFPLEVDSSTGGMTTLEYPHHAIHEGKAFSLSRSFSLSNGAAASIKLTPIAGRYPHMRILGLASDTEKWTVTLFQGGSVSGTNATNLTFVNRNRNSDKTSSVAAVYSTGTLTGSTTLDIHYVGGGTGVGGAKSGAASATDEEFVLKPSQPYYLKVANGGTGAGILNARLFFYDHEA